MKNLIFIFLMSLISFSTYASSSDISKEEDRHCETYSIEITIPLINKTFYAEVEICTNAGVQEFERIENSNELHSYKLNLDQLSSKKIDKNDLSEFVVTKDYSFKLRDGTEAYIKQGKYELRKDNGEFFLKNKQIK